MGNNGAKMKILKISKVLKSASLGITPGHGMGLTDRDPPLLDGDFDKVEAHKNEQFSINRANFKKHQEACPVCSKYDINKELCGKGSDLINGKAFGVKAKRVVQIKFAKNKKDVDKAKESKKQKKNKK